MFAPAVNTMYMSITVSAIIQWSLIYHTIDE